MILPNGLAAGLEGLIVSTSVIAGLAKFAWLKMLKKSAEKRMLCRSLNRKFLINEKSKLVWNGPRYTLRCRLPKPVPQKFTLAGAVGSSTVGSHWAGYSNAAGAKAEGFR